MPTSDTIKHGFFIAGGELVPRQNPKFAEHVILRNHAYVEYFIPSDNERAGPPIILTHNYFTGAAWLSNADGNDGWAQFFARAGFPVFVVDPPGTGRAGFNPEEIDHDASVIEGAFPVDHGFWPGQDSSAWVAWTMGPEWGVSGDGITYGNQMPTDEAAQRRLLATLTPNKPVEQEVLDATFAEVIREVNSRMGKPIFVGWSMAGGLGQRMVLRCPELMSALVLLDGYSGEKRFPAPGDWFDNGPISAADQVADTLTKGHIPLLSVNSATGHISNLGNAGKLNGTLVEKVTDLGGDATNWWLPDLGIQGNGHMMFFERNSDEVASVVLNWINERFGRRS